MPSIRLLIYISMLIMVAPSVNGQNSGECLSEINCDARGVCIEDQTPGSNGTWTCKCDEGFTTFPVPDEDDPQIYCNYKQKEQLVAFLLSFFVGLFAAGRLYCHLWYTAGLKIGLNIGLGCFGMCIISCATGVSITAGVDSRRGQGACATCCACIGCLYGCAVYLGMFAWLAIDCILFGLNEIVDENGVALKPW